MQRFNPCLIINKARDERDELLGESIVNVVQKYLVVKLKFMGAVPFDENVHWSLKGITPFMVNHPDSEAANAVKSIADKLTGRLKSKGLSGEAKVS